jgi:hypothetical protein
MPFDFTGFLRLLAERESDELLAFAVRHGSPTI